MCVCARACACVHMCAHVRVCARTCVHACVRAHVCACMCACVCVRMCVCARAYVCVCMFACARAHACAHVCSHAQDPSVDRLQSSTPYRTFIKNYFRITLLVFLCGTVASKRAVNMHADFALLSWPTDPYTALPDVILGVAVALDGAVGPSIWWDYLSPE